MIPPPDAKPLMINELGSISEEELTTESRFNVAFVVAWPCSECSVVIGPLASGYVMSQPEDLQRTCLVGDGTYPILISIVDSGGCHLSYGDQVCAADQHARWSMRKAAWFSVNWRASAA